MYDKNKLVRAKISLIIDQPFFATLTMNRPIIEDASATKTACTNGQVIKYNPDFFESLSHEETIGVLCHELLHITSLHHTRRQGRNPKRWNRACDYAINPILMNVRFAKGGKITLPKGALYDPQFDNKSAEQIYNELPHEPGDDEPGEGDGMGGVEDAPADTQAEMQEMEAKAKMELVQAANAAKRAGNLPAELERLCELAAKPKVSWKEVLPRLFTEIAKNDYSFSKPNHRYLHTGFILPSLHSEDIGEIVLIVDTSGSVDNEALNEVATEANELCSVFGARLKIIFVDTKVCHVQDVEPDEEFRLEAKGGGGTSFKPGFKWLEKHEVYPKAVIYFTDMDCNDYPPEPDMPVIWIKHGGYQYYKSPPFGEVVEMD